MSKNSKAKASDKKKETQDLEITVKSVVDAILKLGHEEKDANGGGTICSILKIKAFFIGNDPEADAIIIGVRLKEALKMGVDEGAFHRPEKSAGSKVSLQGSFVVPHNNKLRDVIESKKSKPKPPLTGYARRKVAEEEGTSGSKSGETKLAKGTISKPATSKVTQEKEKIPPVQDQSVVERFEMYRKGAKPAAKIDSEEEEDRPVRNFEPTIRRHQLKLGAAAASDESHRSPLTENRILRSRKK